MHHAHDCLPLTQGRPVDALGTARQREARTFCVLNDHLPELGNQGDDYGLNSPQLK